MLSKNRTYDSDIFFPREKTEQDKTGRAKQSETRPNANPTPVQPRTKINISNQEAIALVRELYQGLGKIQRLCMDTYPEADDTRAGEDIPYTSHRDNPDSDGSNRRSGGNHPSNKAWSFDVPIADFVDSQNTAKWVKMFERYVRGDKSDEADLQGHYNSMVSMLKAILKARDIFCSMARTGLTDKSDGMEMATKFSEELGLIRLREKLVGQMTSGNMKENYASFIRMADSSLATMKLLIERDLSDAYAVLFEFSGLEHKRKSLQFFRDVVSSVQEVFHREFSMLEELEFYKTRDTASFLGVKSDYSVSTFSRFRQQVLDSLVDLVHTWQHTHDIGWATEDRLPDQDGPGRQRGSDQEGPGQDGSNKQDGHGWDAQSHAWDVPPDKERSEPEEAFEGRNQPLGRRTEHDLRKSIARYKQDLARSNEALETQQRAYERRESRLEKLRQEGPDSNAPRVQEMYQAKIAAAEEAVQQSHAGLDEEAQIIIDQSSGLIGCLHSLQGLLTEKLESVSIDKKPDVGKELQACEAEIRQITHGMRDIMARMREIEESDDGGEYVAEQQESDKHFIALPNSGRMRLRDLQRDHPELYKAWLRASTGAKPTFRHAAYTSPEP